MFSNSNWYTYNKKVMSTNTFELHFQKNKYFTKLNILFLDYFFLNLNSYIY